MTSKYEELFVYACVKFEKKIVFVVNLVPMYQILKCGFSTTCQPVALQLLVQLFHLKCAFKMEEIPKLVSNFVFVFRTTSFIQSFKMLDKTYSYRKYDYTSITKYLNKNRKLLKVCLVPVDLQSLRLTITSTMGR